MTESKPKWQRRKTARPSEIIEAAMDVFVEKGFAAAKLDEIAKRAGVAKGTLYLYFETKQDVFRAVAIQAIEANLDKIEGKPPTSGGSVAEVVPLLLARAAEKMKDGRVPAILRMIIAESQTFPDLARIWHDDVAARMLTMLTAVISAAQGRGEVRAGNPELQAFSILGPMIAGMLFNEVFGRSSSHAPDMTALAAQHADTVLQGLLISPIK